MRAEFSCCVRCECKRDGADRQTALIVRSAAQHGIRGERKTHAAALKVKAAIAVRLGAHAVVAVLPVAAANIHVAFADTLLAVLTEAAAVATGARASAPGAAGRRIAVAIVATKLGVCGERHARESCIRLARARADWRPQRAVIWRALTHARIGVPREAGMMRVLQGGCGQRCEIDAERYAGGARRRGKRAALTLFVGAYARLTIERVPHESPLRLRMALHVPAVSRGEARIAVRPCVWKNRSGAVATRAL